MRFLLTFIIISLFLIVGCTGQSPVTHPPVFNYNQEIIEGKSYLISLQSKEEIPQVHRQISISALPIPYTDLADTNQAKLYENKLLFEIHIRNLSEYIIYFSPGDATLQSPNGKYYSAFTWLDYIDDIIPELKTNNYGKVAAFNSLDKSFFKSESLAPNEEGKGYISFSQKQLIKDISKISSNKPLKIKLYLPLIVNPRYMQDKEIFEFSYTITKIELVKDKENEKPISNHQKPPIDKPIEKPIKKGPFWQVQITACVSRDNAEEILLKASKTFTEPMFLIQENGLWKVRIGRFAEGHRELAEALLHRTQHLGYPDSWLVQSPK